MSTMNNTFELSDETIQMYIDMDKENKTMEKEIEEKKREIEELKVIREGKNKLIKELLMDFKEKEYYNAITEKIVTRSETAIKFNTEQQEKLAAYLSIIAEKTGKAKDGVEKIQKLCDQRTKENEAMQQQQDELEKKQKQELEEKAKYAKHLDEQIAENNRKIENIKELLKLKDNKISENTSYNLQLQNQKEMKIKEIEEKEQSNMEKLTQEIDAQEKINEDLMRKIAAISDTNENLEKKNIDSVNRQELMKKEILENKMKQAEYIQKIKERREFLKNKELEKSRAHFKNTRKSGQFNKNSPQNRKIIQCILPATPISTSSEEAPGPSTSSARVIPYRRVQSASINPETIHQAVPQETTYHAKPRKSPKNQTGNLLCPAVPHRSPPSDTSSLFSLELAMPPKILSKHIPYIPKDIRPTMKFSSVAEKNPEKKGKHTAKQDIPKVYPSEMQKSLKYKTDSIARQPVSSRSSDTSSVFTIDFQSKIELGKKGEGLARRTEISNKNNDVNEKFIAPSTAKK